jgi:hypothetical protein
MPIVVVRDLADCFSRYTRVFYPDGAGNFEDSKGTQNVLLGLPEEDIDEATKIAIQRAKTNPWS